MFGEASRGGLAVSLLVVSVWQAFTRRTVLAEFPLEHYCGAGVCEQVLLDENLKAMPQADLDKMRLHVQSELWMSPASADRWSELAEISQRLGSTGEASYAACRARQLAPTNQLIQRRFAASGWCDSAFPS
jgi:cytochrome c-type biogenesis protein CcmH/NrfG